MSLWSRVCLQSAEINSHARYVSCHGLQVPLRKDPEQKKGTFNVNKWFWNFPRVCSYSNEITANVKVLRMVSLGNQVEALLLTFQEKSCKKWAFSKTPASHQKKTMSRISPYRTPSHTVLLRSCYWSLQFHSSIWGWVFPTFATLTDLNCVGCFRTKRHPWQWDSHRHFLLNYPVYCGLPSPAFS